MARIVRTTLARADLRDIWLYIAQDNIDAADRLLDRFDRTVCASYVSSHGARRWEDAFG